MRPRLVLRFLIALAGVALGVMYCLDADQAALLEARAVALERQSADLARRLKPPSTEAPRGSDAKTDQKLNSNFAPTPARTLTEEEKAERRRKIFALLDADPDYQAYLRTDAVLRTQRRYADLFRRLALPADRLRTLRETLATNLSAYEASGADMAGIKTKTERDVRALLTAEEFVLYSRYRDYPDERYAVQSFAADCDVQHIPLTIAQRDLLFDAWAGCSIEQALANLGPALTAEQQAAFRTFATRRAEGLAVSDRLLAALPK